MPPSVVLVASACESPSPGASGSLNGSWVAGAVGVDGASAAGAAPASGGADPADVPPAGASPPAASSSVGASRVSGASGLTRIVGFSSSSPLTTYSAGCSSVGPPRGISATARWRPGASRGVAMPLGRATAAGALADRNAPTSVPLSVARTGRYWPDGHHAHVTTAASVAAAAITRPRRDALPALQPH